MNKLNYEEGWDDFYSKIKNENINEIWSFTPHFHGILKNALFHFNEELNLIDFGCGKGVHSNYFSNHMKTVIGLDVSNVIIEIAKQEYKSISNLIFKQFDGLSSIQTQRIQEEYDDSNVFVNGVFHQLNSEDAQNAIKNLKHIIGKKGCLFVNEMEYDLHEVFKINKLTYGELPYDLKLIALSKNAPKAFNRSLVYSNFPKEKYSIVKKSNSLITKFKKPDGNSIEFPFIQYVIKPNVI